ncbi:hypothetical protein KR026_010647, partial [Drosophila bipectinata]
GDTIEGPSNQQANQDNPGSVQEQTPGREITVSPYNTVESHRHWGVFLNRSRTHPIRLLTTALVRYEGDDFGEKRFVGDFGGNLCEFRVWSPFQSKLAAGIMNGLSDLHLKSGANVLYLGAGFGHTVSYVSDIIGESGMVYAVEQGPWAARQLTTLANRRPNVVPVMDDASMPYKYRHQVPAGIDIIFCDLPLSDQVRCLMLNARHYLSIGGYFLVFVRANILEPNVANTLALEKERLKQHQLEPLEEVLLDPFMPGFALVAGVYTREVPR